MPIVQSGVTVKVAVSNLTAGRAVALGATTITGALSVSGNVGIGTASPAEKLQVVGNTLSSNFYNGSGTSSSGAFGADSGGTGAFITMYGSTGANPGALLLAAGSSERMRIDSSGNVGIGTATPNKRLSVYGTDGYVQMLNPSTGTGTSDGAFIGVEGGTTALRIVNQENDVITFSTNGTANERMRINESGYVGIGTASPNTSANLTIKQVSSSYQLQLEQSNLADGYGLRCDAANGDLTFSRYQSSAYTERMRIAITGIVTMSAYGAGTATFSSAGVISSVSDETWKIKDGAPVDANAMLNKLEPGYWYYNDEKKETFGKDRQLGFYAQNVNAAIGPEAAPEPETVTTKNEDGTETSFTKPWGYYDRSVLAVTVMSLQKALATIESLTARITALESKV